MMNKLNYCPKGFDIRNYEVCKSYTRKDWAFQQQIRACKIIPTENGKSKLESFWRRGSLDFLSQKVPKEDTYYSTTSIHDVTLYSAFNTMVRHCNNPAYPALLEIASDWSDDFDPPILDDLVDEISSITENSSDVICENLMARWADGEYVSGIIEVDLLATDDVLIEDFKTWLASERARLSHRKKDTKRRVSDADLASWCKHQLLAYIDLTDWIELSEEKLTQSQIGFLLFPDETSVDITGRVRKVLPKMREDFLGHSGWRRIAP